MNKNNDILPRLIRIRDAFSYLGMDRHRFNKEVRPSLTEIPIGTQGIAFDRLDLDKWVDCYKERNGHLSNARLNLLEVKKRHDFRSECATGVSIKKFSDNEFAKALELAYSKRRKST
jgi:hypothetical protein